MDLLQIIACPSCTQAFEESQGNAAGYAILFMLCIIVPIATAVVICFIRIARRQAAHATGEYDDPFLSEDSENS